MIFVTETWLNSEFSDSFLAPKGFYNIIRRDRNESRGGGICIFVSKTVSMSSVKGIDTNTVEVTAVDISRGPIKHRFVNVYRKPDQNAVAVACMRNLIAELTSICNVDWPVTIV